jgi:hypothetical protein
MRVPVSVLLIRENAEQLTGSGCCGKLDDDDPALRGKDLFRETEPHRRDLGLLHRAIREFFPPLEGRERVAVEIVDPRNQLYLAPKLLRDVLRYRPGWRAGLRTVFQAFSLPAVVLNGRVLSRGDRPLDPDTLCHAIGKLLEEGESGHD